MFRGVRTRMLARRVSQQPTPSRRAFGTSLRRYEAAKEASSNASSKGRSPHASWYSDTVPAMVPIALLGSAIYFGLELVREKLAAEKYLDAANARIAQLEDEIAHLQRSPPPLPPHAASSASPSAVSTAPRSLWRWW